MDTPNAESSRRLSETGIVTIPAAQDGEKLDEALRTTKETIMEKPPVLMSSASEMEDINRSLGYVPLSELNARKAPITPEQVRQKPPDLSSSTEDINRSLGIAPWEEVEARTVAITPEQVRQKPVLPALSEEEELRMIGLVPWEELKARKVPLPSYVPRSTDYYACVTITRVALQETLATHPKIEANHELRNELDHLTYGMAEQLEVTPVDQRKAMVNAAIAQWVESLTPERFLSTDPLQGQRDAYRTVQEGMLDAEAKYPQIGDNQLGYDLGEIVFDMVDTLAGMPAGERRRLVDTAITAWLEALPVEILRELEEGKTVQPVFGETPEFPKFLTPAQSEVEINRSLGVVPLEELKARTVAITPEQVFPPTPDSSAMQREDRHRALGIVPLAELLARTSPITPEQVRQKPL